MGLFGRLGTGSVVRHVGLRAVDITGRDETGGLVGDNDQGTIRTSYVTGRVAGRARVGGLVGRSYRGAITASYAASAVSGSDWDIGGLVGRNNRGTISASYATGAVTNRHRVAGLVGYNDHGTITASYATGAVRGSSNVGGLVGGSNGRSRRAIGTRRRAGRVGAAAAWARRRAGCRRRRDTRGSTRSGTWTWTGRRAATTRGTSDCEPVPGAPGRLRRQRHGDVEEFGDQRSLPGAPGKLRATAGNGRALLDWASPRAFTVGQYPISKYQYQRDSGTWTDIPNSAAGRG